MSPVEYIVKTNIKKRGHAERTNFPNSRRRIAEPVWKGEQRPERQLDSDGLCLSGNHGVAHCERETGLLMYFKLAQNGS